MSEALFEELITELKEGRIKSQKELNQSKINLSKKYNYKKIIKNAEIISRTSNKERDKVIKALNIKPVRSLSGVTVVALFAKPHSCPHGKCMYCPGGPGSPFGDTPQSYTGKEPAAMRAIRNNFDPYLQIFNRLEHYVINGHRPDKLELIFMGGTFPSLDQEYRDDFVTNVYKAINDFGDEFIYEDEEGRKQVNYDKFNEFFETKVDMLDKGREERIHKRCLELKEKSRLSLQEEITRNEKALIRSIGLTIETKPDWALEEHCNEMLRYGCTRFEVGVQTLDENCLKKTNRGHDLEDTKRSFQVMKDMCFKINAHMMLGLPASTLETDEKSLVDLFKEPDYRPDMLKIYPCLVVEGTPLFNMYKNKMFEPIDTKKAAEIIARAYKDFPRYVRVMRVQRDIPTTVVHEGVQNSNLREYVEEEMQKQRVESKDIRAREIGFRQIQGRKLGEFTIKVEEYDSSSGKDYFIDVADENDTMIGFIRLRFPSKFGLREEITEKTALIRELHIYGQTIPVGDEKGAKLYRYTVDKEGIFQKGRRDVDKDPKFLEELEKHKGKLFRPDLDESKEYISYFKEKGRSLYDETYSKLHNMMYESIDEEVVATEDLDYEIAYEDEFQIIYNKNKKKKTVQHKGWGKKLLQKAEEIAKENKYKKMAIISGVGVREYYAKQGYKLEGPYMVKKL